MKQIKDIIGSSLEDARAKLFELGFNCDNSTGMYHKKELRVSLFGFFANLCKSHRQKQPFLVDMFVVNVNGYPDVSICQSQENQRHHFLVSLPQFQSDVDMQEMIKKIARQ